MLSESTRIENRNPLYHGTHLVNLDSILRVGLRPRGHEPSRWTRYESRPDMVYLTVAYGFYFADEGDEAYEGGDAVKLVIEVDGNLLNPDMLYPDEDYLAQVSVQKDNAASIDDCHFAIRDNLESYRLINGKPAWLESIATFGTCAYQGTIPPSAITRYCIFDFRNRPILFAMVFDTDPRNCSQHDKHRKLTAWMFGDTRTLPKMDFKQFKHRIGDYPFLHHINWRREERWRAGIEVVTLCRQKPGTNNTWDVTSPLVLPMQAL